MKTVGKLLLSFIIFGFSQFGWAQSCFLNAAQNGNLNGPDLGCVQSILVQNPGIPGIDVSNMGSAIDGLETEMRNNSADAAFRILSEEAAAVYYNDSYCGHQISTQSPRATCDSMRRLSLLHSSGDYDSRFNCSSRAAGHPNCASFVSAITDWLEGHSQALGSRNCNDGLGPKLYCDDLISSFLQTPQCDGSGSTSVCTDHVQSRFTSLQQQGTCTFNNWDAHMRSNANSAPDMAGCSGASGPITRASVDPNPAPGPTDDTTTPGGDPNANDPPENNPTTDLAEAADRVARDTFGGGRPFIGMNQNALNATTDVPGVDITHPGNGSGINSGGGVNTAGFNPGSNTTPPALLKANIPQTGRPGGTPKNAGGRSGPGGAAGGGGGIAGAGGLGGNNGGGGQAASGGGSGGVSRYKAMADGMNSGFLGTDGAGPAASSGAAPTRETAMDKQVKKAIAENNNNQVDKNALQQALNRNLDRAGAAQDLILRSSYFPGHSEVYIWLSQQHQILNEQGH